MLLPPSARSTRSGHANIPGGLSPFRGKLPQGCLGHHCRCDDHQYALLDQERRGQSVVFQQEGPYRRRQPQQDHPRRGRHPPPMSRAAPCWPIYCTARRRGCGATKAYRGQADVIRTHPRTRPTSSVKATAIAAASTRPSGPGIAPSRWCAPRSGMPSTSSSGCSALSGCLRLVCSCCSGAMHPSGAGSHGQKWYWTTSRPPAGSSERNSLQRPGPLPSPPHDIHLIRGGRGFRVPGGAPA